MDEIWGPYAQWKKPVMKKNTLYELFRVVKFIEKVKWWVPGAWGQGDQEGAV